MSIGTKTRVEVNDDRIKMFQWTIRLSTGGFNKKLKYLRHFCCSVW